MYAACTLLKLWGGRVAVGLCSMIKIDWWEYANNHWFFGFCPYTHVMWFDDIGTDDYHEIAVKKWTWDWAAFILGPQKAMRRLGRHSTND